MVSMKRKNKMMRWFLNEERHDEDFHSFLMIWREYANEKRKKGALEKGYMGW